MHKRRIKRIARRNDNFRRHGEMYVTRGVRKLQGFYGLMHTIRHFDNFTESNDPYGERDFGSLLWEGVRVLWKIDYYDPTLHFYCDPLSPRCKRVMTVMLARDY